MDPATIAILLGAVAASSAASIYTNSQNIKYAQDANDQSIALANTAHQREVRDLQAAGLNPILSASGSGAATPQLKVPSLNNPLDSLGNSASSIASAFNGMTKAEVETAQAEASSAKSQSIIDHNERMIDSLRKDVEETELAATYQALHPSTVGMGQGFDYLSKPWNDLVEQKRNEIEQGRYLSSKEHAIYSDILRGVDSGVNAFSGVGRTVNSARSVNNATKQSNRVHRSTVKRYNRYGRLH